jgi:hypothetical protein
LDPAHLASNDAIVFVKDAPRGANVVAGGVIIDRSSTVQVAIGRRWLLVDGVRVTQWA